MPRTHYLIRKLKCTCPQSFVQPLHSVTCHESKHPACDSNALARLSLRLSRLPQVARLESILRALLSSAARIWQVCALFGAYLTPSSPRHLPTQSGVFKQAHAIYAVQTRTYTCF